MSVAEFKPFHMAARSVAEPAAPSGSVIDLRGVKSVLLRRWRLIAGAAICLAILAAVAASLMSPRYQATAKIIFDPRPMQVLQNGLQASSASGEDTGAEAESQLQVITSADVLNTVVAQLGLDRDPDFGAPPPSLVSTMLRQIRDMMGSKASGSTDPKLTALRALQQAITGNRPEKTYILEVKVQTPDAGKSAAIANAVASAFLNETIQNRAEATRRSGESLGARLDELRGRLSKSEQAVEAFRNSHNLVSANGKPVLEQQLADASNQLSLARARRAEQEARVDDLRQAMKRGEGLDSTAEASLSPVLTALKEQLAAAQRQKTAAELTFGPNHPDRLAANMQVDAARQRILNEAARLTRSAQSDLDRARLAETTIAAHVDQLKSANAAANDSFVHLRELEREAASDRSVYEAFLNRAKELQERQSLDTLDARVLTPAVAPLSSSGPGRSLLTIAGLVLGGLLGVGGALVREQFDDTIRSRAQVVAETDVSVLSVVRRPTDFDDAGLWTLRDDIKAEAVTRQPRHVLIAAVGRQEPAVALARHLARRTDFDVWNAALVDADPQGRQLTTSLGIEADQPAKDFRQGRIPARSVAGIQFVPAISDWAQDFDTPKQFRMAVDASVGEAKLVFIYGGSSSATARMRALASVADDIVFVAEAGRTTLGELKEATRLVGVRDRRLRGVVLTGDVEDA